MKKEHKVPCDKFHFHIQDALYVVGGKWKLLLLSILMHSGTKRFGELARLSGVTPRMLSKELQELEMNKLITRNVCHTKPVTVEYTATDYAHTLKNLILELIKWGEMHGKEIRES